MPAYTHILLSNLDEAGEYVVRGWALSPANPSITISLDIFVNRQFVARVPANTFRSDLQASGYGDGHHAFFFNPFDYLSDRENLIEVRESSSSQQIDNGRRVVTTSLATDRSLYRKARIASQLRWKKVPPPSDVTGEMVFLRHLVLAAHFHPALRILEVGAGHGCLLARILKRKKPFSSYLGVDLSRGAVDSLHNRLATSNIRFLAGDAARYPFNADFDLVLASSVCETLFPSFLPLLKNISRVLPSGGLFVFDLAAEDDRASVSRAAWEGDRYLRFYSQAEIRRLLAQAGMELLQAQIYEKTPGQHRIFVTALKLPRALKNKFESA